MKRARLGSLVLLVLGGALAGCQRGNRTSGVDFFPLHAEDTWVYEVARPLRSHRTRMTVRARGDHFIAALNRNCHLVEESYAGDEENGGRPETYPIAYYRENGFLYRALSLEYRDGQLREIGLGAAEERFLPDQLLPEASWESYTTAYDLGGSDRYGVAQRHRAVLDSQSVRVPAGVFSNTLRVDTMARHRGQHEGRAGREPVVLYYQDWYAPNVGLVRTVQSTHPDGGAVLARIELVAYDVEGAP
jgi:hypothetical protein